MGPEKDRSEKPESQQGAISSQAQDQATGLQKCAISHQAQDQATGQISGAGAKKKKLSLQDSHHQRHSKNKH